MENGPAAAPGDRRANAFLLLLYFGTEPVKWRFSKEIATLSGCFKGYI
jgi:hypothetical protein